MAKQKIQQQTSSLPAKSEGTSGVLYTVATPIGNLSDLTPRACEVLQQVSTVAAEDTRRALILLKKAGSAAAIAEYNEHSSPSQRRKLLNALMSGTDIALTSDAGTPLISDPGYRLVSEAAALGVSVVPVPGASSVTAALSAAGLPTDRFIFEGFAPRKSERRQAWIRELQFDPRTCVIFEAASRLEGLLEVLIEGLGAERHAVLAQEMTKRYERFTRLPLGQLLAHLRQCTAAEMKGEAVLVLAGSAEEVTAAGNSRALMTSFLELCAPAEAARRVAALTGVARSELYQLAKQLKSVGTP